MPCVRFRMENALIERFQLINPKEVLNYPTAKALLVFTGTVATRYNGTKKSHVWFRYSEFPL